MHNGRNVAGAVKAGLLAREVPLTADTIMSVFAGAGLSATQPRRRIAERLAGLAGAGADFAIEQLWQDLQSPAGQVGRATVYRAVDALVAAGILDRVEHPDGHRHYRVCGALSGHHHHLTCTNCHRVREIDLCLPVGQFAVAAAQAGFTIEGHSLEIFGRCAECRET